MPKQLETRAQCLHLDGTGRGRSRTSVLSSAASCISIRLKKVHSFPSDCTSSLAGSFGASCCWIEVPNEAEMSYHFTSNYPPLWVSALWPFTDSFSRFYSFCQFPFAAVFSFVSCLSGKKNMRHLLACARWPRWEDHHFHLLLIRYFGYFCSCSMRISRFAVMHEFFCLFRMFRWWWIYN